MECHGLLYTLTQGGTGSANMMHRFTTRKADRAGGPADTAS